MSVCVRSPKEHSAPRATRQHAGSGHRQASGGLAGGGDACCPWGMLTQHGHLLPMSRRRPWSRRRKVLGSAREGGGRGTGGRGVRAVAQPALPAGVLALLALRACELACAAGPSTTSCWPLADC